MTTYKLNAYNQILEILYVYILICPDIINKILFKPNNFNNLTFWNPLWLYAESSGSVGRLLDWGSKGC